MRKGLCVIKEWEGVSESGVFCKKIGLKVETLGMLVTNLQNAADVS